MDERREKKTATGEGLVEAGGKTFRASWRYRYTQVYLRAGDDWVEGLREDNEWALTAQPEDAYRMPVLMEGERAGVRVGDWPEANAYFAGCTQAGDALTLRFQTRPV